ncbi:HDL216Wp [Eremothecium sinecaudum]|uniref:HDL216Wp n=1 Tax=Eremothecium sinecaudum TaxID=45286 RepID=A0A0X8HSD6_9SACH|nr:HDL216Wp [Eremothecium sinecaudum]AMD20528.1 HDL216Wp [Eremothecium sinecaudum]
MSSYKKVSSTSFGSNNWCLKLKPLYAKGLLAGLSNGHVNIIDWQSGKAFQVFKAYENPINDLSVIDGDFDSGNLFAVSSGNNVKVYDVRLNDCVASIQNDQEAPFLSLDSRHGMLVCGTELQGVDAKIHMYDIKKFGIPQRSFIDSHHDDVTDLKFHPTDSNILLSGSTDGYVNIYDLTQPEEEDALHQVINFSSIHSCGWLAPNRIWTLSHMETFSIHELNDKSDYPREPNPVDFGDIRESWNCNYVIDIYPGFIATGKNQEDDSMLQLIPFSNEHVNVESSLVVPNAHGMEVVRDVLVPKLNTSVMYSGGEDGEVVMWKAKAPLNISSEFWDYSKPCNVFEDSIPEVDLTASEEVSNDVVDKVDTSEKISEKKDEKAKRKKETRSKKAKSKEHRYTPY